MLSAAVSPPQPSTNRMIIFDDHEQDSTNHQQMNTTPFHRCVACCYRSDWFLGNNASTTTSQTAPTTSFTTKLPRRLVCLGKNSQTIVVETQNLCPICAACASRYITISHVWGAVSKYSVPSVPWPVPIHSLEKMSYISNTVRSHGIGWYWVDYLCIDQSNSSEKVAETGHMRLYYQSSDLTLVFLNPDAKSLNGPIDSLKGLAETVANSEWINRAWTLQEAVLPRRILLGVQGHKVWLHSLLEDMTTPYDVITEVATLRTSVRPNATTILKGSLRRKASRKEDKIYGVLGLFPFLVSTEIRYGRRLQDIIADVMASSVEAGDLSLLMGSEYEGLPGMCWKPRRLLESELEWLRHGSPAAITPHGFMCRAELFSYSIATTTTTASSASPSTSGTSDASGSDTNHGTERKKQSVTFTGRGGTTNIHGEVLKVEGNVESQGWILLFAAEIGENTGFVVDSNTEVRFGTMNWKCERMRLPLHLDWHRLAGFKLLDVRRPNVFSAPSVNVVVVDGNGQNDGLKDKEEDKEDGGKKAKFVVKVKVHGNSHGEKRHNGYMVVPTQAKLGEDVLKEILESTFEVELKAVQLEDCRQCGDVSHLNKRFIDVY